MPALPHNLHPLWQTWCTLKPVFSLIEALILESLAVDLESFAGHAKRSVINVEDVKVNPWKTRLTLCSCVVGGTTDWLIGSGLR